MEQNNYIVYVDGYYMTKASTKESAQIIADNMQEELKTYHNSRIVNARSWCAKFPVNANITIEQE